MPNPPGAPTKTLKKDIAFNVMLNADEERAHKQLADVTGLTRGALVRQCMRAMHTMLVCDTPTCANGNRCYVPQMHPQPPKKDR